MYKITTKAKLITSSRNQSCCWAKAEMLCPLPRILQMRCCTLNILFWTIRLCRCLIRETLPGVAVHVLKLNSSTVCHCSKMKGTKKSSIKVR